MCRPSGTPALGGMPSGDFRPRLQIVSSLRDYFEADNGRADLGAISRACWAAQLLEVLLSLKNSSGRARFLVLNTTWMWLLM